MDTSTTEEAENGYGNGYGNGTRGINGSLSLSEGEDHTDFISHFAVQAMFITIYSSIFILGIVGNALVCIVVGRNKAMQTVTNFFICNLALSDILLNTLAVPFTP